MICDTVCNDGLVYLLIIHQHPGEDFVIILERWFNKFFGAPRLGFGGFRLLWERVPRGGTTSNSRAQGCARNPASLVPRLLGCQKSKCNFYIFCILGITILFKTYIFKNCFFQI